MTQGKTPAHMKLGSVDIGTVIYRAKEVLRKLSQSRSFAKVGRRELMYKDIADDLALHGFYYKEKDRSLSPGGLSLYLTDLGLDEKTFKDIVFGITDLDTWLSKTKQKVNNTTPEVKNKEPIPSVTIQPEIKEETPKAKIDLSIVQKLRKVLDSTTHNSDQKLGAIDFLLKEVEGDL